MQHLARSKQRLFEMYLVQGVSPDSAAEAAGLDASAWKDSPELAVKVAANKAQVLSEMRAQFGDDIVNFLEGGSSP